MEKHTPVERRKENIFGRARARGYVIATDWTCKKLRDVSRYASTPRYSILTGSKDVHAISMTTLLEKAVGT